MSILVIIASLIILASLVLWVFHFFDGELLLTDLLREWKLSRLSLEELDNKWSNSDHSDIMVSLTTIPSRISRIDTTLKSILNQSVLPKKIVLAVPDHSLREDCAYCIPDHLHNLGVLEIRRVSDLGPATKIIPLITDPLIDPNQPVLVIDDDRIYPWNFIAEFETAEGANPDAALCAAGWQVPPDFIDRPTTIWSNLFQQAPTPVRGHRQTRPVATDVMLGVMGFLVRPRFFDLKRLADLSDEPEFARLTDDVRTSAMVRASKLIIPVKSLSCLPKRSYRFYKKTALANLNRGSGDLLDRNNTKSIRYFKGCWLIDQTPARSRR